MHLLEKADFVSQLIPGYQYLCSDKADTDLFPNLLKNKYGCHASDAAQAEAACTNGINADDIYFTQHSKNPEALKLLLGKCRLVAGDLEQIKMIDELAAKYLAPNHLEVIGINVIPDSYDDGNQYGFNAAALGGLAAVFRKLKHISVRGCFIEGNIAFPQGLDLKRHFRLCYETAKQVATALPCGMSYVCFGACVDAVYESYAEQNDRLQDILNAAEIVRHQNNTAFYARLLML